MSDEDLYPNEIPNTGIGFSSTDGCPASASGPFVSSVPSSQSGSRTDTKEVVSRLVGGNRPFPRVGSLPTSTPYITCLRAAKFFDGLALFVPKRALPVHERDDVLEMSFARCAEPGRELRLYGRHSPGYKCARLDLNQLIVGYGEEFWLRSARTLTREEFASEYNQVRPKGLENTELNLGEDPCMIVDGTKVGLVVRRFRTFESKAILDVEFGTGEKLGIVRSLDGFKVKTEDHSKVLSVQTAGGRALLTYKMPRTPVHTRICDMVQARLPYSPLPGRRASYLQVISKPREFEGTYRYKMRASFRISLIGRLKNRPLGVYRKLRGDIGEEVLDLALTQINCVLLRDHPQDPGMKNYDSSRGGPDTLRRLPNTLVAYFEGKWWKNQSAAVFDANEQATSFTRGDVYPEGEVSGAYIAILDWQVSEDNCSVTVKRVW